MDILFAIAADDNESDIGSALTKGRALTFTIDCAQEDVPVELAARSFKWDLIDGAARELPTPYRLKQKIKTKPDLVLNSAKLDGIAQRVTYRDLLRAWRRANSRWIRTTYIVSSNGIAGPDKGLVRVVKSQGDLEFQKEFGLSFTISAELEFETMFPGTVALFDGTTKKFVVTQP